MAHDLIKHLYLKRASVDGFRSIHKLNVEFDKGLNILIGKNGVGKSNLLYILKDSLKRNGLSQDAHVKALSLRMEAIESNESFEIEYTRQSVNAEDLEINPTRKFFFSRTYNLNGKKLAINRRGKFEISSEREEGEIILRPNQFYYNYALRGTNLSFPSIVLLEYNIPISLEFIDAPGKIVFDFDILEVTHGTNLDFLIEFFWKLENRLVEFIEDPVKDNFGPEKMIEITPEFIKSNFVFDSIFIEVLAKYTPIKNIRFNPNINIYFDDEEIIMENIKVDYFVNGAWLPWSHLSDGTKRLFYIIAQIQSMNEDIILLEEPELGVHPHQFHLLMEFLKERSDYNQIIISTHSPLALNHLDIDELERIQIVSYTKDNGTKIRRLTPEEQQKAKKYIEEVGYLSDYWVYSDLEE